MERKELVLPPVWCSRICRNSMNEVCVEHCAIKRDTSYFEPKKNLKLEDMPAFPIQETKEMTKDEKFTSVVIYLAKVVEHLQGDGNERYHFDDTRSRPVFKNLKVEDLLHGTKRSDTVYQAGKECEDQRKRFNSVD